jgi:hypothetical protein
MTKPRSSRTTTPIPIRQRERGGAFTLGLNGSGIRRRAPGAKSGFKFSSVLRVRSSMRRGRRDAFGPFGYFGQS